MPICGGPTDSSLIGVFFFLLLLVNEAYIPATLNLKLKYTILVLIIIYLRIIHVRKLRFNVLISNNLN